MVTADASLLSFRIPGILIRDLRALAQRAGSVQTVLLSAYVAMLKCDLSGS
jgi:hypothetical protein